MRAFLFNKNLLVNTFQNLILLTFHKKITQKSLFYRKNAYFSEKVQSFCLQMRL